VKPRSDNWIGRRELSIKSTNIIAPSAVECRQWGDRTTRHPWQLDSPAVTVPPERRGHANRRSTWQTFVLRTFCYLFNLSVLDSDYIGLSVTCTLHALLVCSTVNIQNAICFKLYSTAIKLDRTDVLRNLPFDLSIFCPKVFSPSNSIAITAISSVVLMGHWKRETGKRGTKLQGR